MSLEEKEAYIDTENDTDKVDILSLKIKSELTFLDQVLGPVDMLQYKPKLRERGFDCIESFLILTKKDLEKIVQPGHIKILYDEIERRKTIYNEDQLAIRRFVRWIDKEVKVEILLLGEGGVGKSSMIEIYLDHLFSKNTLVTKSPNEKGVKVFKFNRNIDLIIRDTPGQDRFMESLKRNENFHCFGALLVCNARDVATIKKMENKFLTLLREYDKQCAIFLVCNNCEHFENRQSKFITVCKDLNRIARINKYDVHFTSCKLGFNGMDKNASFYWLQYQ